MSNDVVVVPREALASPLRGRRAGAVLNVGWLGFEDQAAPVFPNRQATL